MINVAIDGPSGSGKSTLSRRAAEKLGFIYVDTGAMYRTIGLYAYRKDISLEDVTPVVSLLSEIKIELKYVQGEQMVFLNDENVSTEIRTHIISAYASAVAKIPEVRAFLLETQRGLAKENSVIMDGRDIGTVVLPDAQVKIFLTASPEIRANRRFAELKERGQDIDYQQLLQDIIERDYQDSHREVAPLKPSETSVILDTSELNFEQSLARLIQIIEEKI
ncbi:MAG: (d)CMP kinase [Clostridia bacterium]|nr:(d)CMP kinase [Clostridia bacterium]